MLPSRGRPGSVLFFETDRELTHQDILRLATDTSISRVGPPILKRLKDNHHAIARYLASGRTVSETAELVGLTPQRVGDLERTDPAFGELLAYYRDQVRVSGVDEAREFRGVLRNIGRGSLEAIKERLEDPEAVAAMETDTLRRLAEMALDRTDAPPRTAQTLPPPPTQITFNMGPRTLAGAQGAQGAKIIDHEELPSDSDVNMLELEFTETEEQEEQDNGNPSEDEGKPRNGNVEGG